jgi:hypothetical protein
VTGELRLLGAEIGDPLSLTGAALTNANGPAFNGDGLSAAGGAFFREATVTGVLRLVGAEIGGQLLLIGATVTNAGPAFAGDGLSATGGANFNQATVTGELRLLGAEIGGQLDLTGAALTNANGPAFNGQMMRSSTLFLQTRSAVQGGVDLTGADVEQLNDNLSSWPPRIWIYGFSYRAITAAEEDRDVSSRLEWIRRNHDYSPGVYDQLAEVYRRAGQDQDARTVAIAREDDRRRHGQLSLPSRLWNKFLSLTVAHDYEPWRAMLFLIVVIAASTVLFLRPSAEAAMVPTKAVDPAPAADKCTPGYECFEPWLYSLDVLLPVVDLHQESNWLPSAERPWGEWCRALTWALIAIGWLLTTALVAAIGTVWRR